MISGADNELRADATAIPAELAPIPLPFVIEYLEQALGRFSTARSASIALDADGTLWDVDVGVSLFEALLQRGGVRAEAEEALLAEARRFEIDVPQGSGALGAARALHAAFLEGRYPDDLAYAMHAWSFAGWSESDAAAMSGEVLRALRLAERVRPAFPRLLEWASGRAVDAYIVSASPVWIVRLGAALLGVPADHVLAMTPAVTSGVVEPRIVPPITYGDGKLAAIQKVEPDDILLGAFGDSPYDAAMLRAARVPVAVTPGPKLLEIAGTIPNLVVMEVT